MHEFRPKINVNGRRANVLTDIIFVLLAKQNEET
jgi:hypothetical protein